MPFCKLQTRTQKTATINHCHCSLIFLDVVIGDWLSRHAYPTQIRKLVIIDWDVHHGNGTQNIFYSSSQVLYFSIHRYQGGAFYPHTGKEDEVGTEAGVGYNVNIPLNSIRLGDEQYIKAFEQIIIPITEEYEPDLIMVSAGFDCAQGSYNKDLLYCYVSIYGIMLLILYVFFICFV